MKDRDRKNKDKQKTIKRDKTSEEEILAGFCHGDKWIGLRVKSNRFIRVVFGYTASFIDKYKRVYYDGEKYDSNSSARF